MRQTHTEHHALSKAQALNRTILVLYQITTCIHVGKIHWVNGYWTRRAWRTSNDASPLPKRWSAFSDYCHQPPSSSLILAIDFWWSDICWLSSSLPLHLLFACLRLFLVLAAFGIIVPVHVVLLFLRGLCKPASRAASRQLPTGTHGSRLCDCRRSRPMAA